MEHTGSARRAEELLLPEKQQLVDKHPSFPSSSISITLRPVVCLGSHGGPVASSGTCLNSECFIGSPPFPCAFLPVLPGSTSQLSCLPVNPCLRVCFRGGLQTKLPSDNYGPASHQQAFSQCLLSE